MGAGASFFPSQDTLKALELGSKAGSSTIPSTDILIIFFSSGAFSSPASGSIFGAHSIAELAVEPAGGVSGGFAASFRRGRLFSFPFGASSAFSAENSGRSFI